MRTKLFSLALGVGLVLGSVGTAFAQVPAVQTDLPPECRIDPNRTADPAAVAAAQRAIRAFLAETAANYSQAGFATQAAMITTKGNLQSNWYDATLPLACGRLMGGYKGMSWVPNVGWR
jgi:hypothetical protein